MGFLQKYWASVGSSLVEAVRRFCHSGHLLHSINHTHIVLIPEVKCLMNMGQLRPISLCNSVYKVLSKVFVNRLQRFLPNIISESQCTFVVGQMISYNTILAQEALHYMKNCRYGPNRTAVLKLDICKAYDRVEWGFLEAIMRKAGPTPRPKRPGPWASQKFQIFGALQSYVIYKFLHDIIQKVSWPSGVCK